jgi:hypothetical protein
MVWRQAAAIVVIDDANLGKPHPHALACVNRATREQRLRDDLGKWGSKSLGHAAARPTRFEPLTFAFGGPGRA